MSVAHADEVDSGRGNARHSFRDSRRRSPQTAPSFRRAADTAPAISSTQIIEHDHIHTIEFEKDAQLLNRLRFDLQPSRPAAPREPMDRRLQMRGLGSAA